MRLAALAVLAISAPARAETPVLSWYDAQPGDTYGSYFDISDFPRVSSDGKRVIEYESDGATTKKPNFRFVVWDRTGAIVETYVVLAATDTVGTSKPHAKLDAKIATANKWLAQLDAKSPLVPLGHLILQGSDARTEHIALDNQSSLEWRNDKLEIKVGGKVVVSTATPVAWSTRCKGAGARLGSGFVDPVRKIAMFTVAFYDDKNCPQESEDHVVSW